MCVFLCMLFACTLQRVWPRGARNSLLPARQWRRPKARLKNHLVDINGGQDFFPNFECYYRVFRCKKRLIYKYIYTILYSEYMYIRTHTHTIIRIYHTIRRICTYSHIHSYFEAGVLHFLRLWEHAPIIQAKLWYQAARLVTMMPFVGSFTIRWFRMTMRVWKKHKAFPLSSDRFWSRYFDP